MNIQAEYCQCGCGQKTKIAKRTDRNSGYVKGYPLRFLFRHKQKGKLLGRICKIEGCNNKHEAKGYCSKHYQRIVLRRSENLYLGNLRNFISDPEKRFFKKVKKTPDGCWLWTGASRISEDGWEYGSFYFKTVEGKNKSGRAHQWSYEYFKEKIPYGKEVHHKCRNTMCVNPEHLEAVTKKEHTAKSNSIASQNGKKTHCLRGHPLSKVRVDVNGARVCRICDAMRSKKYRYKDRMAKGGGVCESYQLRIGI